MVVLGPSGSGKSTYIRCLNRLEEHDAGKIVIDGIEMNDDVRNLNAIRSEVGMVFQQFNLFPHLSVMNNITLGPRKVRRMPKLDADALAMQLLERVGIPSRRRSTRRSFRAGSSSASRSRGRWRCSRRSCSSTSRHLHSTRR